MPDHAAAARSLIALAIIALAASIAYFSYAIISVVNNAPSLFESIDTSASTINASIKQVELINAQLPEIIARIDTMQTQIPVIVEEVAAVRRTIPSILEESAAIRATLPAVIAESKAIRAETSAIRSSIPSILEELQAYRVLIPLVLNESASVRKMIPNTLARTETLVDNISVAGKSASESAVQGFFTGIIKTPFNLAKGMGDSIFGSSQLDKQDRQAIFAAMHELVTDGQPGDSHIWKGKRQGSIRYIDDKTINKQSCKLFEILPKELIKADKPVTICQQTNGEWKYLGQP